MFRMMAMQRGYRTFKNQKPSSNGSQPITPKILGFNDKYDLRVLGSGCKLANFIDIRRESYSTSIPDPLYGYYDDEYYYLTAYGKSTLLNGFNIKYALQILQQKNLLIRWPNNSFTKVKRIGDRTEKLYFISRANLTIFLKQE